jgi:predicted ATPase
MKKYYIDSIKISNDIEESTYISSVPIVQSLCSKKILNLQYDVTFFVGENGTGKSTLLEAIALCAGYQSAGGSKNFLSSDDNASSNLYKYFTLVKKSYEKDGFYLPAENFYNLASYIDQLGLDYDEYGNRCLHEQSHGEGFLSIIQNRFRGNGLYLLDEPDSALSPLRQLTLLAEIFRLVQKRSQFIIVTHSPIILAYPGAAIYHLSDNGIKLIQYNQCDNYILTKSFLDNPDRFLKYLFDNTV